ncbi:DUF4382 domain-containing protein [Candidatus Bathyarchaeota archaeon]|nr:MAG: DUF4382 domain-containing protein [Candidatus Bathyarchaeota archaeon]
MDLASRKMVYYGLLGLLIAGATITVFRVAPQVVHTSILAKDGTLDLYFASVPSDIPSNNVVTSTDLPNANLPISTHGLLDLSSIVSLEVTIDSVMIHSNEANNTGWMEISHSSTTLDLLKPTSVSVLIAGVKVPAQNITMVVLHVSDATASVLGLNSPVPVIVPSGNLKIPLDSGASIKPQMTTSITAERPHIIIEGINTIRLSPVLHVDDISGPN